MYYINGRFTSEQEAVLPVTDLGLLRGLSAFEYLRTYGGRPFHFEAHWHRLCYSAGQLGLRVPLSQQELLSIVQELMKRGALNEAGIKILVTGGTSPDQLLPGDQPRLILFATEHIPPPAERFTQGISVVTTPLARSLPTSKTTHYAPGIIALQKNAGALEALYVNGRGEILEGATSNFFAIKGGTLYTCHSEEILLGITREVVLHLAPLPLKLQPVTQGDSLDEAFITASNKEVMPVVQIDGKPVGNGAVGPHTQRLMQTFRAYTQEPTWAPLSIPRHFH